jgi:tellurite resistance protein TerC
MDWTIFAIVLQLIFLEGILSIDNAAVLGAMVSVLPDDKGVEWPIALRGLGKIIDPLVGKERTAALRVGLLGAYFGRGLMLVLASLIIQNPWLKLVGAFYLIHLAFENLGLPEEGEQEQFNQEQRARGFWMVVLNVELADLVFSLDNVVAAVSLSNKLWVVMLGVAIGILAMRFAAGLFSKAVLKEPILQSAAYILVLNIGIQLLLEDLSRLVFPDIVRFAISLAIIFLSLLYAHSKLLQKLRPVLIWLAQGMDNINEVINWLLVPVGWFFRILTNIFRTGIGKFAPKRPHEVE